MPTSALDPLTVAARFPVLTHGRLLPFEALDSFSGARLWRVETSNAGFALRAWPGDMTASRLADIHGLLHEACALAHVPSVIGSDDGATAIWYDERCWDVTTWLPGRADFLAAPSTARLRAACVALAELHRVWSIRTSEGTVCPALERRRAAWTLWEAEGRRWEPGREDGDPVTAWARRAFALVQTRANAVPGILERWRGTRMSVQPCLCDVWHAHVLFEGERVTGLVDYGSVKVDHVAVDLARLLGSLVGDDVALRQRGLDAYAEVRALHDWERRLVDDLDVTGTIVAAMNWLRWLYGERRAYANREAIAERLASLVRRLEWKRGC